MNTTKIDGPNATVNTPIVRESTTTGPRIPSADLHARRIAREADDWLSFVRERSRMAEHTLVRKALDATAFSVRHRASSFAIPSKLIGTSKHQRSLWRLVSEGVESWAELAIKIQPGGALVACLGSEPLGEIQAKHVSWARPLIPFGLGLRLSRVTGHESQGYRLGVNVVLAHVGSAVTALRDALDAEAGASGDGAGGRIPEAALALSPALPRVSGDGAGDGAVSPVLVPSVSPSVPVYPEHTAIGGDPDDVVLWRDERGAHASVPHVALHSPTGIEWGYLGSGPADLARSILVALTDTATAGELYHDFKAEVIARVPEEGGVLRAADVRAWASGASG